MGRRPTHHPFLSNIVCVPSVGISARASLHRLETRRMLTLTAQLDTFLLGHT